jgi:glycosyltransferase involved in cell wall biosynthesis
LKILFAADVDPDPDAGASGTELRTIQALRRQGHEVEEIWAQDLGRRIRHGNLHYLLELPYAYRRIIAERCVGRDFDVIHANQGHSYLAAIDHHRRHRRGVFVCRSHGLDDRAGIVLAEWRRRLSIPRRRGPGLLASNALAGLLHRHDRLAYRHADGILVSSGNDARFLQTAHGVPLERIGCIAQAPADAFVATPALPLDSTRLNKMLHIGGFAYWKGVHAVAKAAGPLFAKNERARLTWVCRESEHDSVRALLSPDTRARVDLVGWSGQDELRDVYDAHGIFLYPSLFDGFGKVFLEAMARGLCVIGTREGGMPDVIESGLNGILVGYNDPEAMVDAVKSLWSLPERAQAMGELAAATAKRYSWDRVASETADFYRRLLSHE